MPRDGYSNKIRPNRPAPARPGFALTTAANPAANPPNHAGFGIARSSSTTPGMRRSGGSDAAGNLLAKPAAHSWPAGAMSHSSPVTHCVRAANRLAREIRRYAGRERGSFCWLRQSIKNIRCDWSGPGWAVLQPCPPVLSLGFVAVAGVCAALLARKRRSVGSSASDSGLAAKS